MNDYIGEIIQADTLSFIAQCPQLHEPPVFGAFVKIGAPSAPTEEEADPFETRFQAEDGAAYALVFHAATQSLEPGRRPIALGLEPEALRREQPQIFELLATEFSAVLVAHVADGKLRYYLPPRPPQLHFRVYPCSPDEVCAITERLDFLRGIVNFAGCPCQDDLIAASLRQAWVCHEQDPEFLVKAGKQLAVLLRDDYDRLCAVLNQLEP